MRFSRIKNFEGGGDGSRSVAWGGAGPEGAWIVDGIPQPSAGLHSESSDFAAALARKEYAGWEGRDARSASEGRSKTDGIVDRRAGKL